MKIPNTNEREIALWAGEVIDQCLVSQEQRRINARAFRQLYYTGSFTATPSKHNKTFSHVDKLASFLYSGGDVYLTVEFDDDDEPRWEAMANRTQKYINREFRRTGADLVFGSANELALVEGCSLVRMNWDTRSQRLVPWVVPQSFFGVYREDIQDLSRQEAFTHSYYVTPAIFKGMIRDHPDREDLLKLAVNTSAFRSSQDLLGDSYFHEIITGGMIGVQGLTQSNARGTVSVTLPMGPQLGSEVAAKLIRVDDLWAWNDDLQDWTTIRYCNPGVVIEGRFKQRNLSDARYRHPFIKVCSQEQHNYFWGRSELAVVCENQLVINNRVDDIDDIFRLQAKPPRSLTGFMGTSEEKARALLSPGGTIVDGAVGGKVENLAPEMPTNAMDYLDRLDAFFDDAAGFTNILSGQGEPGVRAGIHAGTLLRTSTPRLRDRALRVERQCSAFATLGLHVAMNKNARKFRSTMPGQEPVEFTLSNLPPDVEVTVDSHSSSPAFSEDNRQLAYALYKAGAIDPVTLIEMVHPPREELLKERLVKSQQAQAAALAANPALAEAASKKK